MQKNRIKKFNENNDNMSNSEIEKILDETNLSNKYDRLKIFYQLTKDGYIKQNQFCEILEDYFGLIVDDGKDFNIKSYEDIKKEIEEYLVKAWKPVFDAYPELNKLPVYGWGRYYKYELSGKPFECFVDEWGFQGFRQMLDQEMDWKLLDKINAKHNKKGGEIWIGKWGDYLPNRDEMAKYWNHDSRGGKCVILVRKGSDIKVEVVDCGSPE